MRLQNATGIPTAKISAVESSFFIRKFPCSDGVCEDDYAEAHRHSFFEFICIEKGSGYFLVDETKTAISNGSICLALPSQVHQLIETTPVEGYVIRFDEPFLRVGETEFDLFYHARHFQVFAGHPVVKAADDAYIALKEIMEKMIRENTADLAFKQEMLRRYLKIFLLYLARQCEQSAVPALPPKQASVVERFLALVDEQFLQKKMVADYASELAVTPNYLNDMVKQVTGQTAGHHIRQRILKEIKRQAIYTHASMKEIAYSLGFFDPAHFSKYFKNIAGINYTEFKLSLQGAFANELR